jgi:hypothetical protein
MICEERSGFLFAHACDRTAVWQCVQCGKNICFEHTRMGAGGNTCIACLRPPAAQPEQDSRQAGDDPYFYASDGYDADGYYDADDYRVFDEASAADATDEGDTSDFGAS